MSLSSPFLALLTVPISFIGSFCSSPASASAFAAISAALEAARSLTSWSAIAMPLYVWEELDSPRSESRVVPDLRFLSKALISHEFRK
jgi:hypothetical protein